MNNPVAPYIVRNSSVSPLSASAALIAAAVLLQPSDALPECRFKYIIAFCLKALAKDGPIVYNSIRSSAGVAQ